MKFIADVMLGRLAKRLRLLGYDVLYDHTLDDNGIISLSLKQDRIILTRDTALAARPIATNHFFITNDDVQEQLRQVLVAFPNGGRYHPFTRCSECNEPLVAISREDVVDLVPAYVRDTCDAFLQCPACGRVYWSGTHVRGMRLAKTGQKRD